MKNSIYYLGRTTLVILMAIMYACNEDNGAEDLFDESATERLNSREQELMDVLVAPEQGWKMIYHTDNSEFGGFTLVMKFRENGTVDMISDIDEDTDMMSSSFDIKMGNTIKLSFSTKNHIHKLTDSYFPSALRGTGYKGSGEFLYYGQDGEDRIVFKSVRDMETEQILFEKATESDWATTIEANREVSENIAGKTTDPVYRGIVLTRDGEEIYYPFSYDALRRYVNISGTTSEGKITDNSFGVGFAPGKMTASPFFELEGEIFSEFEWNETEKTFTTQSETGTTARIMFLDRPVFITDDYLLIHNIAGGGHDRFSYRDDTLAETPYTSEAYKELFNEARDNFAATQGGREIYRFEILFNSETEGRVRYLYYSGSSSYSLYHNFTWEVVDQKILISDNGWDDLNFNPGREVALAPIDQMIFNSEGLFVEQVPETFTYSNQVYTFTAADGATVRFPTYAAVQ